MYYGHCATNTKQTGKRGTIKMIKNENYIVIQGWMINELQLKGNDLLIYAIIYGFSQTEGTKFTGSLRYLMSCTGATKPTVIKSIKLLCRQIT